MDYGRKRGAEEVAWNLNLQTRKRKMAVVFQEDSGMWVLFRLFFHLIQINH